jgi:hypothetical protein
MESQRPVEQDTVLTPADDVITADDEQLLSPASPEAVT